MFRNGLTIAGGIATLLFILSGIWAYSEIGSSFKSSTSLLFLMISSLILIILLTFLLFRLHQHRQQEKKYVVLINKEIEERQLAEAMRDISAALNSSLNFEDVMRRIFNNLDKVLPHDTSNVMLIDEDMETARIVAGYGYIERNLQGHIEELALPIRSTRTLEKMYREGTPLVVPDTLEDEHWVRNPLTAWIRSYIATPIRVQDRIIGFLNLNSPTPNTYNQELSLRLQAFADHAGIAINNARLLHQLEQANQDLKAAYETTLLGWAKALELRDNETEGHSQRVLTLTVRMALALGISEPELTFLRYGALLHDIGKIGIPDSILRKPGPLDDDEWKIMRQHPMFGYEILKPIPYLAPAIDIPYNHHEKWDGSGYPRGLQGADIPLSARIFSLADVWDGLLSTRPYRDSWPPTQIIEYLRVQSGKHFEPVLVEKFIDIVTHNPPL